MSGESSDRPHLADLSPEELLRQCDVRRVRRSGPGGQHRNKVETGIVLRHRPTELQAEASERRSQAENLAVAVGRLRRTLALEIRTERDPRAIPSTLWSNRCVGGRIHVNPAHADFPPLLAEALDVLASENFDVAAAAARLACTSSQLLKFLKLEPRAIEQVNVRRAAAGLHRLK